ncbi:MAG TPA: hypothetical protein VL137_18345 [Polyangiaceae bacterium]|nr:hypothetical protein [Polyangiaceae bacterium]
MSEHPQFEWPAQEPPADFAARTTQAILTQSVAGRVSPLRRKKIGLLFLAAALISAGAWAMNEVVQRLQHHELGAASVEPIEQRLPAVHPVSPMQSAQAESPPAREPQRVTRHAASAPPAPSAASSATPPPGKPHVPPCWCDPAAVVCGCGE